MLMPPEAEPVIADRTVTNAATDTSGLPPPTARTVSLIRSKTGNAAIHRTESDEAGGIEDRQDRVLLMKIWV